MIMATIYRTKDSDGYVVGIKIPENTCPDYVESFMKHFFTLCSSARCENKRHTEGCQLLLQQNQTQDEVQKI